jgi:hypothetical protein
MTKKELEQRLEAMESEVADLKREVAMLRASGGVHNHYHFEQPVVQPLQPIPYHPYPWNSPPIITCGGDSAISSTISGGGRLQ